MWSTTYLLAIAALAAVSVSGDRLYQSPAGVPEEVLDVRPENPDENTIDLHKRSDPSRNDKFRRTLASNLLVGGAFGRASRFPASSSLTFGGKFGKRIPSSLLAGGSFGKRSSAWETKDDFDGQTSLYNDDYMETLPKLDIIKALLNQYRNMNQQTKENI